ncbi:MAG: flavin reductase family protein [Chloroflexi bacterium]|nr:flavin reductase family protein [Chloroflexota bacterium]
MPIDAASMRDTLRFWASGVSVVTTAHDDENGHHIAGMTVSAFNSLSLEPPLVLTCLNKDTTSAHLIKASGLLAVSILTSEQAYLSDRFAGRVPLASNEDRFDGIPIFTAVTGAPILRGALAWLDCHVRTIQDGSTHWIVISEVLAAGHIDASAVPLLYYNRAYNTVVTEAETEPE